MEMTNPTNGLCSTSMTSPSTHSDNAVSCGLAFILSPIFGSISDICNVLMSKNNAKIPHHQTFSDFFIFDKQAPYPFGTKKRRAQVLKRTPEEVPKKHCSLQKFSSESFFLQTIVSCIRRLQSGNVKTIVFFRCLRTGEKL